MQEYSFALYYQLSDQIEVAQTIQEKLLLCEKMRPVLSGFVSASLEADGHLPPYILCRDYAPIWYMRTGQWDAALGYINFCISCNAYYPEHGDQELQYFSLYRYAAQTAMDFISKNPGCLQNKIYKQIGNSVDKECLKQFVRYSLLIQKVPCGKTNKLYVAQQP